MRYCGVIAGQDQQHLCALEEVRAEEPPIRLGALFFEAGPPERVATQIRAFATPDAGGAGQGVVAAVAAPITEGSPARRCDEELRRRGVPPHPTVASARRLAEALADLGRFEPPQSSIEGSVPEGSFRAAPVFETNVDGVFCALQGLRVPARRHPLGVQRRIDELEEEHVIDDGGGLWNRRIEEVEAAAAALCAHRYAVGHACWVGDPAEGVSVLPGSALPETFETRGVLPPVERVQLPE